MAAQRLGVQFEIELPNIVRAALKRGGAIREIKMFGGIGFMLNGHMVAATSKRGLLARVGKDLQPTALKQVGARPMIMRGRTSQNYIYLSTPDLNARAVRQLLDFAISFVHTLPPKTIRAKSQSTKRVHQKSAPRRIKPRKH